MRSFSRLSVRVAFVGLASAAILGTAGCNCGAKSLDESDGGDDSGMTGIGGGTAANGGGSFGTGGGTLGAGGGTTVGTGGSQGGGNGDGGVSPDGGTDAGTCPVVLCGERCGPVRDFCNSLDIQCGECDAGLVCSAATNLCGVPEISCSDLSAQCGQIRNSCGSRLNCGACPDAGQECDRNTNHCVDCTSPSCQDLGFQCGQAWLGCGPFSNTVDCGSCDAGMTCNLGSNTCEPMCTPGAAGPICAAAGAQCGFIGDGCGGQTDCGGCDAGMSCGARGIDNECDLPEFPDECLTANRNCGPYTSACGGPTLNCGTCLAPQICNASGRCVNPCTPLDCNAMSLMGKCGVGIDDTCMGTIDCKCMMGLNCTASLMGVTGTCIADSTCATYGAVGDAGGPCSIGPSSAFPQNMTTNLACPCATGGACNSPGTMMLANPGDKGACCYNTTAVCAMNECNTSKVNPCTGATVTCGCTMAGTHCDNASNMCIPNNGCQAFTTGAAGSVCSNGPAAQFPKGDGTNLTCPCSAPGANCYSGTTLLPNGSMTEGTCCVSDTCPANTCAAIVDHCSGNTITCGCGVNDHCNAGACIANLTCNDYGANGANGAVCSNGQSFPTGELQDGGTETDGGGILLTCPCNGQGVCTNGTTVVSGATRGTCCTNSVVCGNQCNTTVMNSCTGAMTACNCGANQFCSGTPGTCMADDTCATYGANGAAGNVCSNSPDPTNFPKFPGDATGLTCNCTTGVCSSGGVAVASGKEGTCCVNATSCGNTCGTSVTNTCTGAVTACTCSGSNYCSSSSGAGTCLADNTCATFSATGGAGAVCSVGNDPTNFPRFPGDGTGLTCNCSGGRTCSSGGMTVSGSTEGTCCTNTASCGNTCGTSVTNTCTGAAIPCTCGGGTHCSTGSGAGVCQPDQSCASYGATGGVGKPCSTGPDSAFSGGPGDSNLTCPCSTGSGFANNTCSGSSSTVAGDCTCSPSQPVNCGDNGKSDGCGGNEVSTCGGGQVCYQNACCVSPVCPAGNAGDTCGVITACGQSTGNCMCTAQYQSCGAVTPSVCGCKPKTLADCGVTLPPGRNPDGCGGFVQCPA